MCDFFCGITDKRTVAERQTEPVLIGTVAMIAGNDKSVLIRQILPPEHFNAVEQPDRQPQQAV